MPVRGRRGRAYRVTNRKSPLSSDKKNSLDDTIGAISRAWRATSEARRSFPTDWLVQRDAVADFKRRYWYLSADGSDRSAPGRLPMAAPIPPDSSPSAPCLDGF